MVNTTETGGGTSTRLPPPPRMPPGYYKLPAHPPPQPPPTTPDWAWNPGGEAPPPQTGTFSDPGAWMPVGTPQAPVGFNGYTLPTPMSTEEIRDRRQAFHQENMTPAEKDANVREQHVAAITAGQPAKKRSYQMTWAEYAKLSPEQKAAVDWNTLLVRAVRSDRQSQDEYGKIAPRQQTAYDQAIASTFGSEDRGSRVFAPETLGLLQQIGYKDDAGDLDDFLKLRTAITSEDLLVIPESSGVGTVSMGPSSNWLQAGTNAIAEQALGAGAMTDLGSYGQVLGMQRGLAARTAEMEATLAKGNQMMATVAQTAEADRNEIVQALGGSAFAMPKNMIGYEPPQYDPQTGEAANLNTAFRDTFDMLSNPAYQADRDKILAAFNSVVSPEEYDAFLSYANARSSTAAELGAPLGNVEGGHYISPRDFRIDFGLVKGANPKPPPPAPPKTPPAATPAQQQYTKEAPPYG